MEKITAFCGTVCSECPALIATKDEALLATLSWASFLTAIRIGKWLSEPFNTI